MTSPRFSILTPVFNPPLDAFRSCAASVLAQTATNWEWVLVDDRSTDPAVGAMLAELAVDERVTVIHRAENGGIVAATNDALHAATGTFVAFLDHDDALTPDALDIVDEVLTADDEVDYVYSDEDKIGLDGVHCDRFRKPAWSPERLRAQNYCCHLSVMRRSLVVELGGLRSGFDGAQDWDLTLRVTEVARAIAHIPHVLYHWRMVIGSVATDIEYKPYALEAGRRAVAEHLQRVGIEADVAVTEHLYVDVRRRLTTRPKVSIIIPTNASRKRIWGQDVVLVEQCVASIAQRSTYEDYEILVVHDMVDESVLARLEALAPGRIVAVPYDRPFNFSEKINLGALHSRGDRLLLLNDDTLVITPDWIEVLAAHLEASDVGMVGPKLLLADGRIQSAGHYFRFGAHHVAGELAGDDPGPFGCLTFPSERTGLTMACVMVPRALFSAVGGLATELPGAFNDIDFGNKLVEYGYRLIWTPHASLYHFESLSRDPTVPKEHIVRIYQRWGHLLDAPDRYLPWFSYQVNGLAYVDDERLLATVLDSAHHESIPGLGEISADRLPND